MEYWKAVTALDQNTATVFGAQLRRVPILTGQEWQDLWKGNGNRSHQIVVYYDHADVYGNKVHRPAGVTIQEWNGFWNRRAIHT